MVTERGAFVFAASWRHGVPSLVQYHQWFHYGGYTVTRTSRPGINVRWSPSLTINHVFRRPNAVLHADLSYVLSSKQSHQRLLNILDPLKHHVVVIGYLVLHQW